jgi:hypothetical protein
MFGREREREGGAHGRVQAIRKWPRKEVEGNNGVGSRADEVDPNQSLEKTQPKVPGRAK